jgi:hypothetical protein
MAQDDQGWLFAPHEATYALHVLYNWTQPRSGNDGVNAMLTGGSGDLGIVLTPMLEARGDTPLRLDMVPPVEPGGIYVAGSILDRDRLTRWFDRLATDAEVPPMALVVDGAYEYTAADLAAWDADGPGSTCKR